MRKGWKGLDKEQRIIRRRRRRVRACINKKLAQESLLLLVFFPHSRRRRRESVRSAISNILLFLCSDYKQTEETSTHFLAFRPAPLPPPFICIGKQQSQRRRGNRPRLHNPRRLICCTLYDALGESHTSAAVQMPLPRNDMTAAPFPCSRSIFRGT